MLLAVAALACGGGTRIIELSTDGSSVAVTTEHPAGCTELGEVYGKFAADDPEQAVKGARIDIRNRAAAMGANRVILQTNTASRDAEYFIAAGNGSVAVPVYGKHGVVLSGIALACAAPGANASPSPSTSPSTAPTATSSVAPVNEPPF